MDQSNSQKVREKIDSDRGLKNQKIPMVFVSLLIILILLLHAEVTEVNVYLFKVTFSENSVLLYFLVVCLLFLTIRYYGYAKQYHAILFRLWTKQLFSDYRIFSLGDAGEVVGGLIGRRVNGILGDMPGLVDARYKVAGSFRRHLVYDVHEEDGHGTYKRSESINLNQFSNEWRYRDFLTLLYFEFYYQLKAILGHREHLDILYPYILSVIALILFTVEITH